MVDAAAEMERKEATANMSHPEVSALRATVLSGVPALSAYRAFASDAVLAPAQHPDWVEGWAKTVNPDVIVVMVMSGGFPVLALPLEIVREAGLRVARPCGGRHANGTFPAIKPGTTLPFDPQDLADAIAAALKASGLGLHLLKLERLQPEIDGIANPLILSSSTISPNVALACDLAGGFEAVMERHSGKRKRKKHRNHARKFEETGSIETGLAQSGDEARALLDAFFAMKSVRFRELGISDVFAEPEIQAFFRDLFAQALSDGKPDFVVHYLKVGGVVRAVTGSSLIGNRMICEFSGFVPDETENTSPGDYLFYENIQWACQNGYAIHDFSVGDELYKRLWCDIEFVQSDTVIALSLPGRLAAGAWTLLATAKRRIKASPALWSLVKRLRQMRSKG